MSGVPGAVEGAEAGAGTRVISIVVAVAVTIIAAGALINFVRVRTVYNTAYNDHYAIPLAITAILLCTISVLIDVRAHRHVRRGTGRVSASARLEGRGGGTALRRQAAVALVIGAYAATWTSVPFIPRTWLFLVLVYVVMTIVGHPGTGQRAARGRELALWALAAAVLSGALHVVFSLVLNAAL